MIISKGWAIGPKHLVQPMQLTQQYIPFCVSSPLQEALGRAWEQAEENNFFPRQRESSLDEFTFYFKAHLVFLKKRNRLLEILESSGLKPILPQVSSLLRCAFFDHAQASYFILADTTDLDFETVRALCTIN